MMKSKSAFLCTSLAFALYLAGCGDSAEQSVGRIVIDPEEIEFSEKVAALLSDFDELKAGMTRSEIESQFPTDGGVHRRHVRRYQHPSCRYFKVEVEYEPSSSLPKEEESGTEAVDRAIRISRPYLEAPFI